MLDGAGDTDGDIEIGGYDFASLAHLIVIGHIACVNGGAGGTDGSAKLFGHGFKHFEIFTILHAAPA